MATQEDEESFEDFDFEDLPHDALTELENNAIQFTQAQQPARPIAAASSDYGDDFEDEDLDDNVVVDELRSTPALNPAFQPRRSSQQRDQLPRRPTPSSEGAIEKRLQAPPPPRFGQSQRPVVNQQRDVAGLQPSQPDKVATLQRQIEELIRERNTLQEDLNAKSGEIAIVRSKQDKTVKEYERELISLRKFNADALARQGRELEAARISERAAATERDFLRQETAETVRARRVNQAKEQQKKDDHELLTPRKKKLLAHRDGFDDDEIEFLSPSKNSPSKLRKTNSPSKPGKRKRKNEESPAGPLEVINFVEPPVEQPKPMFDEAILKKLNVQDDRFDFLGTMLDHRLDSKHKRTIEELGKYFLPSSEKESLQSIILGKIPALGRKNVTDLPLEFCELIISLWTKCMEEKYFSPIYLFVDILTLALELKTSFIAPHLIDSLVPLTQQLVEPIIVERFKNRPPAEPYDKQTGSTACLSLLYVMALGCMCENKHILRFWKYMRYDLTMMMFTPNQLMADTELMLKLLSTSIFRDRFGAPAVDESQDRTIFSDILNKLTLSLTQVPLKPKSDDKFDPEVVSRFRLQILQLMTSMTRSPYASKFMATHRDVIGRLVKLISDELDELYDYKPEREASARIISLATRLLYHLVTKHEDVINMQKKLSVVPGGSQKYLLCLARLNFSEDDLVLESGIHPEVATCALELLEMVVTPEEGDAIHSAFSSQ